MGKLSHYQQNPDVVTREIDGLIFLIDTDGQAIYALNRLGTSLWRLMSAPTDIASATNLVFRAFPRKKKDSIETDIRKWVAELMKRNLLSGDGRT